MNRLSSVVLSMLAVCLFSVAAVAAASKPAPAKPTTAAKSAHVTTKVAPAKKVAATRMAPFTKTETLDGKLSMVLPEKGIIVVTNSSGVPFDFKIAHATVDVNGAPGKANTLASMTGKEVSVRFLPYRSGDFAEKIAIGA